MDPGMRSPFPIGVPVTGEDLADRDDELAAIEREILGGSRLFVISPRRYGKTSLLSETRNRLVGRKIPVAMLDLYQATSLAHFLDLFARAVLEATEGTVERAVRVAGEHLRGLRPTMTVGPNGQPEWSLGMSQQQRDLLQVRDRVLALPQAMAERRKVRVVVFLDEFQEIRELGDVTLEKAMRAAFQKQPDVSYVFAGSKESLMQDMVRSRRSAFYRSGPVIALGAIPRALFAAHLVRRFRKAGMPIEPGLVDEILRLSDDVPYNAQYLCHAMWTMWRGSAKRRAPGLGDALDYVLRSEGAYYAALWQALSLHQRRTLAALAREEGVGPFEAGFLRAYDLGATSTVARSLAQLVKKEILRKADGTYRFGDPFLRVWIASQDR